MFLSLTLYALLTLLTTPRPPESFLCLDCHQFNTMLLRTVVLLLLCMSVSMCATIGHYQTEAKEEEEAPSVTDGAVAAASVDAAEEGVAPADAHVDDSPAAEEPAANSLFGDNLLAKILAADNPAAGKPEADVPVADGATAEEPGTDSDKSAGDGPDVEALTAEAVTHEQPFSEEEEEGTDIRPVQTNRSLNRPLAHEDNSWSLNSIRNSFQTVHGYFDSLVELVGGHNGVCQYRCRYGKNKSLELTYCYVTEDYKSLSSGGGTQGFRGRVVVELFSEEKSVHLVPSRFSKDHYPHPPFLLLLWFVCLAHFKSQINPSAVTSLHIS